MTDPQTPSPVTPPTLPSAEPAPGAAAGATQAPVTPAPVAPAKKRRWITPTLAIAAALAVGFAGGVLIGRSGNSTNGGGNFARSQFGNGQAGGGQAGSGQAGAGQAGGAGGFAGGGFTSGKIVSIDGTTIVVEAQDGTKKTVKTSTDTKVTKTTDSSASELKKGQTVTVIGAADSSGDVTATSISEGDSLRGGFGRQGAAATPDSGSGN